MKERLEQRYNLAYRILNEKIGRDCYFPDGPPRCIVCPIRVSSLGTAAKRSRQWSRTKPSLRLSLPLQSWACP